jgi:hypothetical protein
MSRTVYLILRIRICSNILQLTITNVVNTNANTITIGAVTAFHTKRLRDILYLYRRENMRFMIIPSHVLKRHSHTNEIRYSEQHKKNIREPLYI